MAKLTDIAKEHIIASLEEKFEGNTLIVDKKLYIDVPIEQELVQIAVTLTAPKTPVTIETSTSNNSFNEAELEAKAQELLDLINF